MSRKVESVLLILLRKILVFVALLSLGESLEAADAASQLDESYALGLQDYKAGRFKESVKQLKLILQTNPAHKQAAMLLGTIYYQHEKLERARGFFERTDASAFTADSSFAYGATYMEFGEYKKAAAGFRHAVKAKGPYREFAIYYLGVIYYRQGQWSRARRFFQTVDAQALPVFLRINRRRYLADLRHEQDKVLNTIISSNDRGGSELNQSQPSAESYNLPRPKGSDLFEGAKDGENPSDEHENSNWRGSVRPTLLLTQQSSTLDNYGITQDVVSIFAHRESVRGELAYQSAQDKGKVTGSVQVAAGSTSYQAQVQKTQYFKLDQTTGAFTSQNNRRPSNTGGFGELRTNLGIGLNPEWRIDVGGAFLAEVPSYVSAKSWGQSSLSTGIRFEGQGLELGLEGAVMQPFDAGGKRDAIDFALRTDIEKNMDIVRVALAAYYWETDNIKFVSPDRFRYTLVDPSLRYRVGFKSELGASGGVTFNFGELSLLLRGEYFDRTISSERYVNRISSLDDIETAVDGGIKMLSSLSYPIWDSFSLIGAVGYNILTAYIYSDRDVDGTLIKDYVSDIEQMTYQLGALVSFGDWLQVSGSYAFIANTYADKKVATPEFKRSNPDYIENSSFYLTITKSF